MYSMEQKKWSVEIDARFTFARYLNGPNLSMASRHHTEVVTMDTTEITLNVFKDLKIDARSIV